MRPSNPDKDGPVEQVLEHPKSNYGGRLTPIGLTWDNGAFVADTPSTGMIAHIEKGRAEKIFLKCLDALNGQKRWVSSSVNASNYAPREMMKLLVAILARLVVERAARGLLRALPLVGVLVGSSMNAALTQRVGRRCMDLLENRRRLGCDRAHDLVLRGRFGDRL